MAAPAFDGSGFIVLSFNGHPLRLSGLVKPSLNVNYHASFEDAAQIGSLADLAAEASRLFGINDLGGAIASITDSIGSVSSELATIVAAFTTAPVKITDLQITSVIDNTNQAPKTTRTFMFGMAMDLRGKNLGLAGITIDAFGFSVTVTRTTP